MPVFGSKKGATDVVPRCGWLGFSYPRDRLLRLAQEWLGGFTATGRPHGNNLWLSLPEGLRAAELLATLEKALKLVTETLDAPLPTSWRTL